MKKLSVKEVVSSCKCRHCHDPKMGVSGGLKLQCSCGCVYMGDSQPFHKPTPLPSKTRDSGKEVEGWAERFDEKFVSFLYENGKTTEMFVEESPKEVKAFIRQELAQAREERDRKLRRAFIDLTMENGGEEDYAEKEWKHLLGHIRIDAWICKICGKNNYLPPWEKDTCIVCSRKPHHDRKDLLASAGREK